MTVFRKRDREKRRERKAYHAAAMKYAVDSADFASSDLTENQVRHDAWTDYLSRMVELGAAVEGVQYANFRKAWGKARKP